MSIAITEELLEEINKRTQMCFQCNTCVSGCPVFKIFPEFKPAELARELFLNHSIPMYRDQPAFWLCSSCLTCEQKCPQDVDIAHIFYKLKNWSVENNVGVPEGIIKEAETMKMGITTSVSQSIVNRRKQMGLPELPKADLDEVNKILKNSGFSKKLDDLIVISEGGKE
jgi:heterodisulfide reductase subunit C